MLHLAGAPQRLSVTGKLPSTGTVIDREPVMRTKVPNGMSKSAIALRYAMSFHSEHSICALPLVLCHSLLISSIA